MIGHQQRVNIEPMSGALVVRLQVKQIEYPTMAQIERRLAAAHTTGRGTKVVVDLSQVEAIPSVMMGALVDMLNRLRDHGHRLVLCGLNDKVRGSFTVTRLDELFDIADTVEAGLAL